MSFKKIALLVGVIAGAMVLFYVLDDWLGMNWPSNVMRNWQQHGFANLHGKLVYNPGGFEIDSHPEVYSGMSPVFLYPVYFATAAFSWTGLDTMSFQILFLLVMIWASWSLLGKDHFALMVALVTVLCPGYLRWTKLIDPGALSILPVLPYAVLVLAILRKPKLTPLGGVAIVILTLGLISLNWTVAWVCGPCVFFLLGSRGLNRGGLLFLLGLMCIGVPLIAAASFASKAGLHTAGGNPNHFREVIGSHLWGSVGYGLGLTTGRAFLREAFVNGIGLFPLWLLFIYGVVCRMRAGGKLSWIMFAPLALAAANLVIMRNYFGHHPWMAGPTLIVGIIFSLALVREASPESSRETGTPATEKIPFKIIPAVCALCFVYGFAVLVFYRANETNLLMLVKLIRQHTARADTIVVVKSDVTASLVDRLEEIVDRHMMVADDVKSLAGEKNHWVILSAVKMDDHSLAMTGQSEAHSASVLNKAADWFNHSIAKRNPGDRLELSDTFYLYAPETVLSY